MTGYTVLVDENAHYQDESERYEHGTFGAYEEAVAACRRIVDEFLTAQYRPGMTASELYDLYTTFGDDPFIRSDGPAPGLSASGPRFSAWEYARQRSAEALRRLTETTRSSR